MLIGSYVSDENLSIKIPSQNNATKEEADCFISWALCIRYDQDVLLVLLPLAWLYLKADFSVLIPHRI